MNEKKHTILVIDSQFQTKKILELVLNEKDFRILSCQTGKEALQLGASTNPDLVLLDLNLSDMDGVKFIKLIKVWTDAPIIILTERSTNDDVIAALNLGAADYVTKPFNMEVLEARINSNLRQSAVQESGADELHNGPLRIDLMRHQVWINETLVGFTPKEYDLLKYFVVHKGKMLLHKDILKEVWGNAHGNDTQYLRVFIGQVRKKIEAGSKLPGLITTEAGIGYRMDVVTNRDASRTGQNDMQA